MNWGFLVFPSSLLFKCERMQAWDGLTLLTIYFYTHLEDRSFILMSTETNGSKKDE